MENKKIIFTTVIGTGVSILIALLFFGIHFNDVNRPPIYFLILGFSGSLSLALFRQKRIRDVIYINILVYLMFAIAVSSVIRPITAFILLIYFTAMVIALYLYVKNYNKKLDSLPMARPLMLAAIVGVFYIFATFIHSLLFISQFTTLFLLRNFPIGFLLGLSYGLAEEISDRYLNKKEKMAI